MKTTFKIFGILSATLGLLVTAQAQQAPSNSSLQYKADKITIRPNGVRLDGNAEIKALPQLEADASASAFDFSGSQITEVRASGNVRLKVTLTPKGGGKKTRIETTASAATLKPQTRELTLTGNVDGFYQPEGQSRTTLAGTKVVMNYVGADLNGIISGPIKLSIPAETLQGGNANAAPIGAVTITSREAKIDGKLGVVRFVGDARAISAGGANANAFDVSAAEFILTRTNDNTIETLKTAGRTRVKIDLPPQPAKPGEAPSKMGRPTKVEAEADSAVVNRATSTLTFEGNVTGFYVLTQADAQPQKYDFTGAKAIIRYVATEQANAETPAGLKADITGVPGKPVEVSTPAFNFDLSN